jgi:hypothetical protein
MARDERDVANVPADARARDARAGQPQPAAGGAYQEGSVESVGGGPSGTDTDDRTGQGGTAPSVPRAPEAEGNRDVFISSEVAEESAGAPGRPERTRS